MGKTYRGRERDRAKKAAERRRKEAKMGYSSRDDYRRNRDWRDGYSDWR